MLDQMERRWLAKFMCCTVGKLILLLLATKQKRWIIREFRSFHKTFLFQAKLQKWKIPIRFGLGLGKQVNPDAGPTPGPPYTL